MTEPRKPTGGSIKPPLVPIMLGDGRPETLIPLPNRRRIPVTLHGGADGADGVDLTFSIHVIDAAQVLRWLRRSRR